MRDFGADINDHLAAREGVVPRHLLWVEARNRVTGAPEPQGFWNGLVSRQFTVGGVANTYVAAGSLLNPGRIVGEVGLKVQYHTIRLSGVADEVQEALNLYDLRLAPVTLHEVFFDPVRNVVIGEPQRLIRGTIDEVDDPTSPPGEERVVTLRIADAVRDLTRTLTATRSDEDMRRVSATDRGYEYATISGVVDVFWGTRKVRGTPGETSAKANAAASEAYASIQTGR